MVAVGLMVKLASAVELVPTKVVKPGFEYHFQLAPVPRVPPVWVNVTLEPLHIGDADVIKLVGATDG